VTENKLTFLLPFIKLYILLSGTCFFLIFDCQIYLYLIIFKSFKPSASIRINLALSYKTTSEDELFFGELVTEWFQGQLFMTPITYV